MSLMTGRLKATLTELFPEEFEGLWPERPGEVDHLAAGLAAAKAGDDTGAKPHLEAALAADAACVEAVAALARLYLRQHNHEEAERLARTAVKLKPKDGYMQGLLGEVLQAKGDLVGAEHGYQQAVALNEKFTDGYIRLGVLRFEQKRFKEAIPPLERGVSLDRTAVAARYYLARATYELGDAKRALTQIYWLKQLMPDYLPADVLRGLVLEKLGDRRSAVEVLDAVIERDGRSAGLCLRVAKLRLALGETEQAVSRLEDVLACDPGQVEARYLLADFMEQANQLEGALEHYRMLTGSAKYRESARMGIARVSAMLELVEASLAGAPETRNAA